MERLLKGKGVQGMIILIDGYNLLKQRDSGSYIEDSTRNQLIRQLGAYHKRRRHDIVLVFDGGIYPWPVQEAKSEILVLYAGYGKSADDYIKDYIAEHHKEELLLVSSDRELALWASKYDVASMNSLPFYGMIINTLAHEDKHKQKPGAAIKTTTTEDPLVDALMADSTADVVLKEEDYVRRVARSQVKSESKIERLLRKKIEKL